MKVLVTGSSGQIGSYVVDRLRAQGIEAVGMDRVDSSWTSVVGDVQDKDACLKAVHGCEAVIHCAAQISVQASIEDPAFDHGVNAVGTLNLLEAARRSDVNRFVYISSAAIYGDPVSVPIDEDHPLRPMSPYGASKATGELYTHAYRSLYAMEIVAVRPFNVYSKRQDPTNPYTGVISRFCTRVQSGQPPVIFGDGLQTRDFIHAQDVARILVRLATGDMPPDATLNLGTGQATSVLALAEAFLKASGLDASPVHEAARPGEIRHSVAQIRRATATGWRPEIDLGQGVKEMLAAGRT